MAEIFNNDLLINWSTGDIDFAEVARTSRDRAQFRYGEGCTDGDVADMTDKVMAIASMLRVKRRRELGLSDDDVPPRNGFDAERRAIVTAAPALPALVMQAAEPFRSLSIPDAGNPFAGARVLSLDEQIENVEAKLAPMIRKAETAEHWAEICAIEARELVPLLKLKVNERIRQLHAQAPAAKREVA